MCLILRVWVFVLGLLFVAGWDGLPLIVCVLIMLSIYFLLCVRTFYVWFAVYCCLLWLFSSVLCVLVGCLWLVGLWISILALCFGLWVCMLCLVFGDRRLFYWMIVCLLYGAVVCVFW